MPDATGERTHETTIALTPLTHGKLSKVHSSTGSFQTTHSEPRAIMVIPMMPPTHECVVETGISRYDASSSQMPTAMMTHVMPYMSRPGLSSKQSTSAMPLRICAVERGGRGGKVNEIDAVERGGGG